MDDVHGADVHDDCPHPPNRLLIYGHAPTRAYCDRCGCHDAMACPTRLLDDDRPATRDDRPAVQRK